MKKLITHACCNTARQIAGEIYSENKDGVPQMTTIAEKNAKRKGAWSLRAPIKHIRRRALRAYRRLNAEAKGVIGAELRRQVTPDMESAVKSVLKGETNYRKGSVGHSIQIAFGLHN